MKTLIIWVCQLHFNSKVYVLVVSYRDMESQTVRKLMHKHWKLEWCGHITWRNKGTIYQVQLNTWKQVRITYSEFKTGRRRIWGEQEYQVKNKRENRSYWREVCQVMTYKNENVYDVRSVMFNIYTCERDTVIQRNFFKTNTTC